MNNIIKMLKGMLIGVGAILPGVSGGMIAAAFNIYDKLIEALDMLTSRPIKAMLSIWQYLVGIGIGILVGFLLISTIFMWIPIPATLLFIGLILGGVKEIYRQGFDRLEVRGFMISGIAFLVMIASSFMEFTAPTASNTSWYLWIIVGILLTISLIVPGLSGTMLLMMIGFYIPMLDLGHDLIDAVLAFDFNTIWSLLPQALFVLLGLVIAFVGLGKLLNLVLKKFPKIFFQIVLGIIIASPINIIVSLNQELKLDHIDIFNIEQQWWMWLIGLALFPLGFYIARLFTKEEHETEENQGSNI
jgi:putative membrane protein